MFFSPANSQQNTNTLRDDWDDLSFDIKCEEDPHSTDVKLTICTFYAESIYHNTVIPWII